MKNKLFAILLCLALLFSCAGTAHADSSVYTVAEVEGLCDGIVAFKGYSSTQSWIDGGLSDTAGSTAEFYIIALAQSGSYDFSRYERALLRYLDTHEVYSATTREKYALTLAAVGSTDSYITSTCNEAIGGLGLMSLIFGLHLLNNGYESSLCCADGLVSEILSYQFSDGGWAIMGSYGDVDVTAMTIQALAPYYGARGDVTSAVDAAVDLLSRLQQDSGAYKGMGVENCESTAQVLTALSDIGIDAQTDSRFIKNGSSVLDGMLRYRNGDGSFTHAGGGYNESATVEAFYAMKAYLRNQYGQGPLYLLDGVRHDAPPQDNGSPSPSGHNGTGSGDHSGADTDDSFAEPYSDQAAPADHNSGDRTAATSPSQAQTTEKPSETETAAPSTERQAPTIDRNAHGGFQSSATEKGAEKGRATADESSAKGGYKLYAVGGIILLAGIACGILFLLKKRGKKHYIAVGIIAGAGILFVLLTNFQSTESFRETAEKDGDVTVTMSIRCDTILDRAKVNDYIPKEGVILDTTTFTAEDGDTVYDVLIEASKKYDVTIDNRGADGAAYIAGINYLYEFDYGALSGWMYRVNGEFPDVGCQSCTVHDGDTIEWLYTTDIGHDLE